MTLLDKALQIERRMKQKEKPQEIEIIVCMNPCFDCGGCEKCADFHKETKTDPQTKNIIVNGEDDE